MAMIHCLKCGEEISDEMNYCVHCGAEIERCPSCGRVKQKNSSNMCFGCGYHYDRPSNAEPVNETPRDNRQRATVHVISDEKTINKVFAYIGMVIGIFSLVVSAGFGVGIPFSITGIVFSSMGIPSKTKRKQAVCGLYLSITALVLSCVLLGLEIYLIVRTSM